MTRNKSLTNSTDFIRTISINVADKTYTVHTNSRTSAQKEFIIDSGAAVSVTYSKALIRDLKPFKDLLLIDSGGHEHWSEGIGTISIGGYQITCYWATTLKVSVVSTKDPPISMPLSYFTKMVTYTQPVQQIMISFFSGKQPVTSPYHRLASSEYRTKDIITMQCGYTDNMHMRTNESPDRFLNKKIFRLGYRMTLLSETAKSVFTPRTSLRATISTHHPANYIIHRIHIDTGQ